jgi:pimeloyl-ACP methyl ester carboxylesterase
MEVRNAKGELLSIAVEGEGNATIVFVHGMLTDKNEGSTHLLVDIAKVLQEKYRIIRFDLSGCGESEGAQEDGSIEKWAGDLQAVLNAAKQFGNRIFILTHSAGMQVVTLLSPSGIEKSAFMSPPGFDSAKQIERLQKRILSRNGVIDENGTSIYPRFSGDVQKIGKTFWASLRSFNTVQALILYSKKTNLLAIRPLEDKIIKPELFPQEVKAIYLELPGDHNFSSKEDREKLIETLNEFFSNQ